MKRLAKSLACALAFALATAAGATSFSTDSSDLWWNPNESGWGLQLVQQGSFVFATIFVYGADKKPTWFTGELQAVGSLAYSGPLYATEGPSFGGTFKPDLVTTRQAGAMTWQLTSVTSGTVTYSVDGVSVTKNLVRQNLVEESYNGSFLTVYNVVSMNCDDPGKNVSVTDSVAVNISHDPVQGNVSWRYSNGDTCSMSGTFQQNGRMAQIGGNYSCSTGEVGTTLMFEMTNRINVVSGRVQGSSTSTGCRFFGNFTGLVPRT